MAHPQLLTGQHAHDDAREDQGCETEDYEDAHDVGEFGTHGGWMDRL